MKILALALVGTLGLAGCSATTGTLTPAAQATVTQYLASYCPVEAAVRAQAQAGSASVKAADSLLQSVCPPNPAPTNAVVAVVDLVQAYAVIAPLVAKKK